MRPGSILNDNHDTGAQCGAHIRQRKLSTGKGAKSSLGVPKKLYVVKPQELEGSRGDKDPED